MTNNIKYLIIAILSILIGLGAGYFIFNSPETITPVAEVHDHSEPATEEETIWTCAMHPQIQQNEPGLCPLCQMELTPLDNKNSSNPYIFEMTPEAVKLAQIQTTIIGNSSTSAQNSILLSGKIKADERRASSLVAHVPGRIEKLYVSFTGEQVKTGQKIATIYSPDLIAAQKELLEAIQLEAISPGLADAARNKLRYWKISKSDIQTIEEKGTIRENFDLYAEASGIVTNRRVAVGDYISQGTPLFDLMNLKKVWVIFDAYERDIPNIKVGNNIQFTTPSLGAKTFKTKITFIDPVINPQTRVASVRAEVQNHNGLLKPEMFVNGVLQNNKSTSINLTIPKTAVLWTGKESVVYVQKPDTDIPSFEYRLIEIGERIGAEYQVLSGLEAGESVVTNGSFTIDAAAQFNNQMSMMNKKVRIKKEQNDEVPDFKASTTDAFKGQLSVLSLLYLDLKDALVDSDPKSSKEAVGKFIQQLEQIDMTLLKGEAHLFWMDQLNILNAHSNNLYKSEDIDTQRNQFRFVSNALIDVIKSYGIQNDTLYVQYCPMVDNNKGGDWISDEESIKNPYFGDKMLTCGNVKDQLIPQESKPVE